MKQQSITAYAWKTTTGAKQPILVTKQGIKEHLLAIITTCDLVSIIWLAAPAFHSLFDSHFALLNVQLFEDSSPTWILRLRMTPFLRRRV